MSNSLVERIIGSEFADSSATFASIGITREPNPMLSTIEASISAHRFEHAKYGTVFITHVNRPYAGDFLATLLNSVVIRYPQNERKAMMRADDMTADHMLGEYAHEHPYYKNLHIRHLQDPSVGPHYKEFVDHHALRWAKAEKDPGFNNITKVMLALVDEDMARKMQKDAWWKEFLSDRVVHEIGKRPLLFKDTYIVKKGNAVSLKSHDDMNSAVIDSRGRLMFYVEDVFIEDGVHAKWPASWRISELAFSPLYRRNAIQPVMAWRYKDGQRSFLSQETAVKDYGKNLPHGGDVSLGKALLAYLSPEITKNFAWHMKLRNVNAFQEMAAAQVPVWASLKQYAGKLLAPSNPVIKAIESAAIHI